MQVDIKHGDDARLWPSRPSSARRFPRDFADIRELDIHGVLAAPVCTYFSGAGAKHPRSDDEIRDGLALIDSCVRIAWALHRQKPLAFFALENPVGKLVRWLGQPTMSFQPCEFGDPYTKRTLLWGWFNKPTPAPVEPTEGSKMHAKYGGKSERTKTLRSMTPMGFARAFQAANP